MTAVLLFTVIIRPCSGFITPHFSVLLRKNCWRLQAGCLTCVDFFLEEFCCGPCCLAWTFLLDSLSVCEGWNLLMDQDHLPHWTLTYPKAGYLNPVSECKWFPRMPQVKAGGHLMKTMLGTWTIYILLLWYTSRNLNVPYCTVYEFKHVCLFLTCHCVLEGRWHHWLRGIRSGRFHRSKRMQARPGTDMHTPLCTSRPLVFISMASIGRWMLMGFICGRI